MAAQSFLAKLGLRLSTLGSAASLAVAAPLAEGDLSQAAHTDANRIGFFFDRTPTAEKVGVVVMGTTRARLGEVSELTTQLRVTYDAARLADSVTIGPMTGVWVVGTNSTALGYDASAEADGAVGLGKYATATSAGAIAIGDGAIASTTIGTIAIGRGTTASGGTAIGYQVTASGIRSVFIGDNGSASAQDSIGIGSDTFIDAAATGAVAIGANSFFTATALYAVAIGDSSGGSGAQGIAIGRNATSTGTSSISIGYDSDSVGAQTVVIGLEAYSAGTSTIAIGYRAGRPGGVTQTGAGVLIGVNASAGAAANVVGIGSNVVSNGSSSTAVGATSQATADWTIALGRTAQSTGAGSIAIGAVQITTTKTAGIGQTLGDSGYTYIAARYITDFFIGGGSTSTTCEAVTIRGSNASGTNISSGGLILHGGISTGNALGGGVTLRGYLPGASGAAAQSTFSFARMTGNGFEVIGGTNVAPLQFWQHTGFSGIGFMGTSQGYTWESRTTLTAAAQATLGVFYSGSSGADCFVEWGNGLDRSSRLARAGGWTSQARVAIGRDQDATATTLTLLRVGNRNAAATLNLTGSARYFEVADYNTTSSTQTDIFWIDNSRNVSVQNNLYVGGKLTVVGLIDPTGMQFTPVVANPGTAETIWVNSGDSNRLYYGASPIFTGGAASLTATYVGYGDGSNLLTGESTFTYNAATNTLAVEVVSTSHCDAATSAGVHIGNQAHADVAIFGAGGGTGTTLYGQLNGTSALMSGTITTSAALVPTHVNDTNAALRATAGGITVVGRSYFGSQLNANADSNFAALAAGTIENTYSTAENRTGFYSQLNIGLSASLGQSFRGAYDSVYFTSGAFNHTGAIYAAQSTTFLAGAGSTGTLTSVDGVLGSVSLGSNNTVTTARGVRAVLSRTANTPIITTANVLEATATLTGATVTSLRGLLITGISGATNNYGIDIGNVSGGTTNIAIRTGTGLVSFGDVVNATAGTAGAPAYAFTGDPDTGIYSGGANILSLASGGTVAADISTSTFTVAGTRLLNANNGADVYRSVNTTLSAVRTFGQWAGGANSNECSSISNQPSIQAVTGNKTGTVGLAANRTQLQTSANFNSTVTVTGLAGWYEKGDLGIAIGGGALTITNYYGGYIANLPALAAGVSLANQYGIYMEQPTRGSSRNEFLRMQVTSTNYAVFNSRTHLTINTDSSYSGVVIGADVLVYDNASTVSDIYGIAGFAQAGPSRSGNAIGVYAEAYKENPTAGSAIGVQLGVSSDGATTVDPVMGVDVDYCYGYRDVYGIRLRNIEKYGVDAYAAYGIRIEAIYTDTIAWAIYVDADPVFFGAAQHGAITTVSGNTTLDSTHNTVLVDATAGNIVITIPLAANCNGRVYDIKKIDSSANTVTITCSGADTVDGAASLPALSVQYQSRTVKAQASSNSWWAI